MTSHCGQRSYPGLVRLVAVCWMLTIGFAGAQEPAVDLESLLADFGYSPASYHVVFHWQERAPSGDGELVAGCRLAPRDGAPAFELYWDEDGILLDMQEQTALGIRAKNWTPRAISQPAEIHPGFPKAAQAPRPKPISPGLYRAIPELGLPPPDLEKAAREDAAGISTPAKDVARIGVFVDLAQTVEVVPGRASEGAWRTAPDGASVWALSLRSLGALGLRIHFAEIELPGNARLIVYNAEDPAESYGPFAASADFWTPTCFGEAVVIECHVPAGVSATGLYLRVDRVSHQYKAISYIEKAGYCNLDVSCYSAWQTTAMGIGGLGTIGATGSLWCTGSLIADGDPATQTPYFLTANHCVGTNSKAGAVEVYWLYQSESCGGSVPAIASVPRTTGGATLLATSNVTSGSDFSFLRLKQSPPEGLAYLGFSTQVIGYNTDVAVIHHPSGDFKRISFGVKVDSGSPSNGGLPRYPRDRFHEILWTEGTTEGGSSGSPLMLSATHQIIGQLYGGYASCTKPEEPDYFGRFDYTYPLVESWLGPVDTPYDLNQDGSIDATDLQLAIDAALHRDSVARADVDSSGYVDAVDLQLVANAAISTGG